METGIVVIFPSNTSKKRKTIYETQPHTNQISKILQMDPKTKKWLVEWVDLSRSWELYESVKDTNTFRKYVENLVPKQLREPTYIS